MSPEVLIYVQSIKNFIKNDEESRNYFLNGIDEELFYSHLSEISQKNFEKDGEAMLTQDQFEDLRLKLHTIMYNKKTYEDLFSDIDKRIIFKTNGYGIIYLN